MEYRILFDFGSTFTKSAVISKEEKAVVFTTRYPSTVKEDAQIAMEQCLSDIEKEIGKTAVQNAEKYASSSAAGGLRIVVVGLTYNLSISAGRNAAFGAGAKIIHVTSGALTKEEVEKIEAMPAEMILLCGGYENGNQTIIRHNAEMIAKSQISCPVIYGGNSQIAQEIRAKLLQNKKECFQAPNVIPQVGVLDIDVAEEIIRHLFMNRIVDMKGLGDIIQRVDGPIVPTPAAVLDAGMLMSQGVPGCEGLGELMIVDIGGATTDIHSYAEHTPYGGARLVGADEPYARRTVEGDLGMRESSDVLVRELGVDFFAEEIGVPEKTIRESIGRRVHNTKFLPENPTEKRIDQLIAESAAYLAARRHAGVIEHKSSNYCRRIQHGKNLTHVQTIIGTGGPIINSENPEAILKHVLRREKGEKDALLPSSGDFVIDENYILYAVGLLSYIDKNLAFDVGMNSIIKK